MPRLDLHETREADLPLHRLNQLYDDFWRQGAVTTRTQAGR